LAIGQAVEYDTHQINRAMSDHVNLSTGYKKPPVVEAVIAISFSTPLDLKTIDAFARKRKKLFPRIEDINETTVAINMPAAQSNVKKVGCKLTSSDGTHIIIITRVQIAVCRLNPYADWNTLYDEAREHWKALASLMKRKEVSHASTRFINRIDIPIVIGERIDINGYFNIGIKLPSCTQEMSNKLFNFSSSFVHKSGKYRYILQMSSSPSPLLDHESFIIDIDIATTGIAPLNEDKLWELVGSLRPLKNELFEACITAETRKLFQ
jgi:uncharacterized protein (TIGR04255 family)